LTYALLPVKNLNLFISAVLHGLNHTFQVLLLPLYLAIIKDFDLDKITHRVGAIYGIDKQHIVSKGRQRPRVEAWSLLCYWAVRGLWMTLAELARLFVMSPSLIGYSVQRGETIAEENTYQLMG